MSETAKKYLVDILKAIELIDDFMSDTFSFFEYHKDFKTKSAIERQLGIIGEAVNQFSKAEKTIQLKHMRAMISFRNRLIHAYDAIDDTIVWVIVKNIYPFLKWK